MLLATIRLGELLPPPSFSRGKDGKIKGEKTLPKGLTWKQSHQIHEISDNKEIVHEIIAKAIDRDDIATRHDVLKKIKESKRQAKIEAQKQEIIQGLEQPTGLFDIIVVDPPWEYQGEYDSDGRRGTTPYPTMSIEEWDKLGKKAKVSGRQYDKIKFEMF